MNISIYEGALSVPVGTVRWRRIPWWLYSQPYLVGSISGGDSRSAAFQMATCRWHLCTFSMKASVVGGREQSFTDNAPLLPVFVRHRLILHSVTDAHSSATFPYATHKFCGLCFNWPHVSICCSNFRERIFPLFGYLNDASLPYSMKCCYSICSQTTPSTVSKGTLLAPTMVRLCLCVASEQNSVSLMPCWSREFSWILLYLRPR